MMNHTLGFGAFSIFQPVNILKTAAASFVALVNLYGK